MNAINENMNPETAKKHNPRIPYIAAANMGKSMMDLFLQELKAAPDVWQKMTSKQQSEVIERIRLRIEYATAGAVNTIVTGGHTALAGTIDTVNIKDKIKLTVIVSKSNLGESLAELYAAGSESACQILLADAAQYCGGMDLIEADPDQPALFGNEPELPDDQLLWAVNVPMLTGATNVPAPSRKEAEMYARSIREKLIELDRAEFASSVYALPWQLNRGEHMRQYNNGNWESLINWFSQLCAGEIEVKPVALIEYAPEDAPTSEILTIEGTAETVVDAVADDYIEMEYQESRKILNVEGRMTTQLSKVGALSGAKSLKFGEQECMFEYMGFEYKGEAKALWEIYRARPLIALTDEHPRIKVSHSPINGGVYRATCNSRSSTSTSSARGAVDNLLKKMDVTGQVVEITTLDDIEREVQMFTVIA